VSREPFEHVLDAFRLSMQAWVVAFADRFPDHRRDMAMFVFGCAVASLDHFGGPGAPEACLRAIRVHEAGARPAPRPGN
jgi:hypothetical protein